jgi:ABC-type nickel/cobalt efflux system permease component RcnA
MMFPLITGLLAGAAHVWAGPDHMAAVAPLAARRPSRAWKAGGRWGLGHSAGVAVVGLLALWLRDALPLEAISSLGERLVGVMLVAIGFWAIRRALQTTVHVHEHEHDGSRHVHFHTHHKGQSHSAAGAHQHAHAAVGIGILHGLAGSSHFLGVLPMLAFATGLEAALYLASFAFGTVLSMAVFAGLIGFASRRCARRSGQVYRGFMSLCGGAAVVVGCTWVFLSVQAG